MTELQDTEPNDETPFNRRDVLKLAGTAGAISAFGAQTTTAQPSKDFIVGTKPGKADIAKRKANSVKHTMDFGPEIGEAVAGRWPEEALQGLKNNPNIRYIEEDTPGERHQQTLPWGVDRIDAEVAHADGDTGSGVDVAIIDSGIDSDHNDLEANLGTGHAPAKCSDCCSGCDEEWEDTDGHGTAVAGIVGAIDDTEDVIGVAPEVTLHAIKDGDAAPNPSDTAKGLEIAADEGYDIANISSSVGSASGSVGDSVEYADNNGVVIVASAGNNGACTDCVSYPARDSRVIAVSNITQNDNLAPPTGGISGSSQGPEVDLGAPGRGVTSTANGGGTTGFGGTSAAAPHVSAAAAHLIANGTSPSDVRSELKGDAEEIGLSDNEQGAGLLDLAAALSHDSANDLTEVETDSAIDIQYTEVNLNGEVTQLTGNDTADVFFEYREVGGTWTTTPAVTQTGTGTFTDTVTGLEQDTTYEFRAAATVFELDEGWSSTEYGDVEDFDTADNPDPTAAFTHDPDVPDPNEPVTFDASESDPGNLVGLPDVSIVSYEWDYEDDGTFDDNGKTITIAYPDPGTVTVRLRVTDEFDQTDEASKTLRVNEAPNAAFDHSPSLPDEDEPVEFDASDSVDPDGDIVEYAWDFGDGTTETTTDPVIEHTYAISDYGNQDVTLTVTDNDDATDEVTETIRINAVPKAEFDVVTDPPARNEPVEFDASASEDRDPGFGGEVDTYEWDFGDGTTETTTDPVIEHTYTTGGKKTVTLRVTDNDGASHDDLSVHEETFTVYIRVAVSIQPNDSPNSINLNRRGEIPVAVLQTSAFDPPSQLDDSTVHFGDPDDVGFDTSSDPFSPEGGATPTHSGGHVEDVDGDGDDDSLFHFKTQDSDFESDDDDGKVVGLTSDDIPVFGTDSVNIVGGGGP